MSDLVGNPEDRFFHIAAHFYLTICFMYDVYSRQLPSCRDGLKVIKLFSSSAQLSMKFQLLTDIKILKISGKFRF